VLFDLTACGKPRHVVGNRFGFFDEIKSEFILIVESINTLQAFFQLEINDYTKKMILDTMDKIQTHRLRQNPKR
jgi:hypothetical protein